MKVLATLLSLICLSIACSQQREPARTAVSGDFEGKWVGRWDWDASQEASVEIKNSKILVNGLPLEKSTGQTLVLQSAKGRSRFEPEYGPKGLPCILLYLDEHKEVIGLSN